jgi:hypothetical protein
MAQITLNSSGVASSGSLLLQSNGTTTAVTIDASQNMGLGVTPSAWGSSYKSLEGSFGQSWYYNNAATLTGITSNTYNNGTNWIYKTTNAALRHELGAAGDFRWYNAASGTAGNTISFTQSMTLDANSNLGINGQTSPGSFLNAGLTIGTGATNYGVNIYSSSSANGDIAFARGTSGANLYNGLVRYSHATDHMSFWTASTERARIDSSGNVAIGQVPAVRKFEINAIPIAANQLNGMRLQMASTPTSAAEFLIGTDGSGIPFTSLRTGADGNSYMTFFTGSGPTERLKIDSSGGLILVGSTAQKATGTTWSNPSDQRLKDNIRDYAKGTTELMQVRVREWEYNGKGGTTEGMKGLGVIADEVMTVLPNTVEDYDAKLNADDEETTAIKKFDATEITWLLVKTVQEQQALITQLQADVAALKGTA